MTTVTIRFEGGNVALQSHESVARLVGFVSARNLIHLFDIEDLDANPRVAKVGEVTESIMDSIREMPSSFPFMTKGILVGTTSYESLDRNRYRLHFENTEFEGIMDGGHNMLAIGLHILTNLPEMDPRELRRAKDWPTFKNLWIENRDRIMALAAAGDPAETEFLDFVIPIEIVVPQDITNDAVVSAFRGALKEICDARNHNVQLRDEALANKAGLYDDMRAALPDELNAKIEWRQNEGGEVKSREIVALAMIPLNALELPAGINPISPVAPYNSKAGCVDHFTRVVEDDSVSVNSPDGTRRVVTSKPMLSAFKILADIPAIYDEIYKSFPEAYNRAGGRFGSIAQVKNASDMRVPPTSKFTNQPVNYQYPDGFIYPLVMGVGELIGRDAEGLLSWKTDPIAFIRNHLGAAVVEFRDMIDEQDKNPNKVGKLLSAYHAIRRTFAHELLLEQLEGN